MFLMLCVFYRWPDEGMEKKEKTSPIPGSNLFDPATLLGKNVYNNLILAWMWPKLTFCLIYLWVRFLGPTTTKQHR